MSLVTCFGADVLRGEIHMAIRGAWWAELVLDLTTTPTTSTAEIVATGGLSITGAIAKFGTFLDQAHVRVVGGAGGLDTQVLGAFRNARLGDPLGAILRGAGERLSSATDSELLVVDLPYWTVSGIARNALDELAIAAAAALGEDVNWRVLGDGFVWMGREDWLEQALPDGADIVDRFPAEGRIVIGVETPALFPGVNLTDVGRVIAVDHYIGSDSVRTHAWV